MKKLLSIAIVKLFQGYQMIKNILKGKTYKT